MIQPQSFLPSGEEDFEVFLPYMGMAASLFNGAKPFEQSVNTLFTSCDLVKIAQEVSEKKTFKNKIAAVVAILDFRSAQS